MGAMGKEGTNLEEAMRVRLREAAVIVRILGKGNVRI